jgi:hypothetical protein
VRLGIPDLVDVLSPVAKAAPSEDVRAVARSVIERASHR